SDRRVRPHEGGSRPYVERCDATDAGAQPDLVLRLAIPVVDGSTTHPGVPRVRLHRVRVAWCAADRMAGRHRRRMAATRLGTWQAPTVASQRFAARRAQSRSAAYAIARPPTRTEVACVDETTVTAPASLRVLRALAGMAARLPGTRRLLESDVVRRTKVRA